MIAPYLFWALWRGEFHSALIAIFIAGITDGLDGYLARRLQVSSRIGEILDPIADKVLLSCAFVALWLNGAIEGWLTALILGRDVVILAAVGVAWLQSKNSSRPARRFPPSIWGKLSTIVQISLVFALAARLSSPVPEVVKWTAAALTVISFLDYCWRYTRN